MSLNKWLLTSVTDNRATPQSTFDMLNRQHSFTLDPCADDINHKCDKYYTKEQDWLVQDWSNEVVFMNPPYGRDISKRVKKASDSARYNNAKVVCLLPARTDTQRFHNYIYNYKFPKNNVVLEFCKWRLKFGNSKNSAPFPSMIVIFNKSWQ